MSVWDNDEPAPPAEYPAPITEQPTAETPETETLPTETATPEVESPVVEGEAATVPEAETPETEEEPIREDVPLADIEKRFSNSPKGARNYITRLTQKLDDAKAAVGFQDKLLSSTPATELLDDLYSRSESRYADLGNAYWATHRDQFLTAEFGMTAAELKQKLETPEAPREPAKPRDYDEDELLDLPDWAQKEIAASTQREQELSNVKTQLSSLQEKLGKLEKSQTETVQSAEAKAQEEIQTDFFGQVRTHAIDYLANSGLKALDSDPPKVKAYIERANQDLADKLFDEFAKREQYKADGDAISDAITRRDKARVKAYIPKVKVAAEIVLDELSEYHKEAVRAMRTPAKQETKTRPEISGTTQPFAASDNLVRGKGVDALWGP